MAGVLFSFYNFASLIDLNIGISDRLDENRSESFTILFCDFSKISQELIDTNLPSLLRTSDSIVHNEHHYFFVMPYTDRYGCGIVKKMKGIGGLVILIYGLYSVYYGFAYFFDLPI